ncbi:P-loop containing nucleoside triphosphate hydrolase protein [Dunaliella salina]|uniref:P-loop containing nucleoside triphosphate hydrolase protein n=1 Tax=Dunaliella salina TaxID=3046 RepID=A0ABQ7G4S5_DUNSA|nr:P-loop containing nucleoside triphosphate hydrolase protein [Dunaliella salina]|eukprot:KAF5829606.1 P-loop containing nucleoside triphosphate hydrolase protein [Dunaliella salina]
MKNIRPLLHARPSWVLHTQLAPLQTFLLQSTFLPHAAWAKLLEPQLFSNTSTSHGQRGLALDASALAAKDRGCATLASTSAASSSTQLSNTSLLGRGLRVGSRWLQGTQRGLTCQSHSSRGKGGGRSQGHHGWGSNGQWTPPSMGVAAAAAFAASVMGWGAKAALAEAGPPSPVAAAQASVDAAWEEVSEDLQRLNARLPRRSAPFVGKPPKVSTLGSDGVEVVVPLREGADANAVLAELLEGFASRKGGAGSRSSSMQTHSSGAARTVHLDVHEEGSRGGKAGSSGAGGGHVTARLHMPPPGSADLGSLVITKRGPQGFSQQLMAEMAEAMEQHQGVFGEAEEGEAAEWPGSVHDDLPAHRPQRLGPGGKGRPAEEEGGYDWGSPQAAQAVKQLQLTCCTGNQAAAGGYEEQKRMIEDCLLLPLLRPDVYESVTKATRQLPASNRPRAVLFEGPPGTGKGHADHLLETEVVSPESEGLLAKVFKAAEALGGAIIFIDELDSLGGSRERGDMHEASRRLLSVLLREMDGFDAAGKRAVVIGATNRKVDLDPALMSRFDLSITFGVPDESCRALILKQYAQQLNPKELQQLAAAAGPSTSGRDLRDLCEHAERRWASKIIRKEAPEGSLPPIKEYLASASERLATIRQTTATANRPVAAAYPFSFLPPR